MLWIVFVIKSLLFLVLGVLFLENAKRQRENGQERDERSQPSQLSNHNDIIFCVRMKYMHEIV